MESQGATHSRALTYGPNKEDIKREKLLSDRRNRVLTKNNILSKLHALFL